MLTLICVSRRKRYLKYPRIAKRILLIATGIIFAIEGHSQDKPLSIKDSLQKAALIKDYARKLLKTDSIPADMLQAGRYFNGRKEQLKRNYESILKIPGSNEIFSGAKDWRGYIDRLSPGSLTSGIVPELRGKSISHTGLKLYEQGQVVPSYFTNSYDVVNSIVLADQITIKHIPININFTRQDMSGKPFVSRNIFSSSFNKDAFLQDMRKKLKQKIKPEDLFPESHLLETLHENVENILRQQVDSMISNTKAITNNSLRQLAQSKHLLDEKISGLSQQIFSENSLQNIRSTRNLLQQLKEKINNGQQVNKLLMDSLNNEITQFNKVKKIYKKIATAQKKWKSNKLVQRLKQIQTLKDEKFDELLSNPATLKQLAAKYLPLHGLEKAFLHVNSLNLGQHTTSLSPLSLQNFTSSGVSMEIEKKNKYLMLIAGKEQDLNTLFDRRNFQSLFPNDQNALGISFGMGGVASDHTHITLMSYHQQKSNSLQDNLSVPQNNSLVAGIDNQFSVGENTTINIELSKSVTRYDNGSGPKGVNASVFSRMADMGHATDNMAAMIRMHGHYQKIGLNTRASFSLIADSYNNPGNIYLPGGTKEMNFSMQKYFLKRRVVLNARGDIRRYNLGINHDGMMQNTFFSFEGKWHATNGEYISLSYQPARNVQISNHIKSISGITNRLQLTGSVQQQVLGTFYRNILSVTRSKHKYDWGNAGKVNSTSMIYTSMQSVVLQNNLLYLNLTYNHADNMSSVVYFNSTFTSELGYTYPIGKKINASSGIEYDAVKAWYRQAGIRQSLSVDVNSKLQLSFFVDLKKNIAVYNTGYYNDLYQADWSLSYSF